MWRKIFLFILKIKPLSPLICYYGMTSYDVGDIPDDDIIDPDSDILDMEPLVQPRPRYGWNRVPLMYLY